MREKFFTKRYRIRARALACDCYDQCDGDVDRASAMAEDRKGEVGSVLVMLTIGVLAMQAIYYAFKIWSEWNLPKAPTLPIYEEGFGLAPGEPYALTPSERQELHKGS